MTSMKTNREGYNRVKAAEPEIALSPYFIRRMVLRGRLPHKRSGNKVLLNPDAAEAFLKAQLSLAVTAVNV